MCFAFKEISLRSVSLPLSLCAGEALHFGAESSTRMRLKVIEAINPWIYFMTSTIAVSLIVTVDKLTLGHCA